MLSILIPVYNFDIRPLVGQLQQRLTKVDIVYEIICQDDASDKSFSEANSEIDTLSHTSYRISDTNLGRIATRQILAEQANYEWLLFMDADVLPKSDAFIQQYLKFIDGNTQVVYGGFAYYEETPQLSYSLRWNYGRKKEQVSAIIRNNHPYKITISANFLINKSVFIDLNTLIDQKGYGYDNYFASLLKQHQIQVLHIDNEVYHLGLESNTVYLDKVEHAVKNLLNLFKSGALPEHENSLLKTYQKTKRLGLMGIVAFLFRNLRSVLKVTYSGQGLVYSCFSYINWVTFVI